MKLKTKLRYLEDRWDEKWPAVWTNRNCRATARTSWVLPSHPNFGGGNTSSNPANHPLMERKNRSCGSRVAVAIWELRLQGWQRSTRKSCGLENLYRGAEFEVDGGHVSAVRVPEEYGRGFD
jgi:hypothetical protein